MSSSQKSPPQAFHLFPLLATELQLRIWEFAIAAISPRAVELRDGFWTDWRPSDRAKAISARDDQFAYTTDGPQKWEWQYTSTCAIPAPLHTCHISRSVALTRWALSFAEEGEPAKVFFDCERDILWFGEKVPDLRLFFKAIGEKERTGVRRVAINFEQWVGPKNFRSGAGIGAVLMKEFPLLEDIVLVGSERFSGVWGDALEGHKATKGVATFVENVDGSAEIFGLLQGSELDALGDVYRREGKVRPNIRYRDYTREDLELFEMEDKLQWLQMED